ncbi:hypothetical protein EYV94_12770 [Puteibacter caeruleilacunae]|nr:hypothetical protein EYV94_12770 [Puteibacter caeruleilacunae]
MKNNLLIDIIRKDIKDLEAIIDSLSNSDQFAPLELRIAADKAKNLYQEIQLLEVNNMQAPPLINNSSSVPFPEPLVERANPRPVDKYVDDNVAPIQQDKSDSGKEEEPVSTPQKVEIKVEPKVVIVETEDTIEPETKVEETIQEEVITEAQETKENKSIQNDSTVLGEKFGHKESIYDKLAENSNVNAVIDGRPIKNLSEAIGLNDKFLFIRELFNNNHSKFDEAIEIINNLQSIQEAADYLKANFKWQKNEASTKFLALVKRKFQQ